MNYTCVASVFLWNGPIPTWKVKTLKDCDVVKAIFPAWGEQTEAGGHNFAPSGPFQTRCAVTEGGSVNKQNTFWVRAYETTQCHNPEYHTMCLQRCGNLNFIQKEEWYLMFCWLCIVIYQYSRTNKMHFLFSVYYELTTSTYFKHYLRITRRRCIYNNWYILCLLCWLAATRVGVKPVPLQPW
jgi:hypothetical protein